MKKILLSGIVTLFLVFASSAIVYACPGGCVPPIKPSPSDIVQPSSADIELTCSLIIVEEENQP